MPWDAVELPSQFMENFAWDPRVVIALSCHHVTGESLPNKLLERLQKSRSFQAGMQMMRQLEFGLFDWRIHTELVEETGGRIDEILAEVREQVAVVPYPSFNRLAHSFAHVFGGGYAAGYYSYKWAEVLAADAFAAFQGDNLFNREVAQAFTGGWAFWRRSEGVTLLPSPAPPPRRRSCRAASCRARRACRTPRRSNRAERRER